VTRLLKWSGFAAIALLLLVAFGRGGTAIHAQNFSGVTLTVNVASDDVAALDPSVQVALIGTWTIAFDDNGGYAVGKDNTVTAYGTWQLNGNELTLTDLGGSLSCSGDQATGTYAISYDGSTYAFTSIDDTCQGRVFLMTVHRFTAQ
jgi:hypothetical protein